ncbi:hypothetical protein FD755_021726, partial [Muntiacus reevesi]
EKYDADDNVKIICLGASAVGKSKLMERFLMEGFQFQQLSTYTLMLYKHTATIDGKAVLVDFWDTAGQERFQSMHTSCYHKAHSCIMLREFRPQILCIVVANKIYADMKMAQKSFSFARKFSLPLYVVSAADGTSVVKLFNDTSRLANIDLEQEEEERPDKEQHGCIQSHLLPEPQEDFPRPTWW